MIVPVRAQDAHAETTPQRQARQSCSLAEPSRRDDGLDGDLFAFANDAAPLADPQPFLFRQRQKFGRLRKHDQHIALLELDVVEVLADDLVLGLDADDPQSRLIECRDVLDRLFRKGLVRQDGHFGQIFRFVLRDRVAALLAAIRQKKAPHRQHEQYARRRRHKPDQGDLEDRERFDPLLACHAVDKQVGRGPDQRQRAAENGGIGERDQ